MDNALPANLVEEWTKFLAKTEGVARGFTCYDIGFEEPVLFPLQRRIEMEKMMEKAQEIEPRVILDIGADKGFDAWSFIACHPYVEKIIIIEIRGVPYIPLFEKAFPDVKILGIADSSYAPQTVARVKEFLGDDKIDVAFLDGDKCRYDSDFHAYLPLMRSGGIVFMHDCNPKCNPKDFPCGVFFRSLAGKYKTELILDESEHEGLDGVDKDKFESSHQSWLAYWSTIPTCGVGVVYIP